MTRLRKKGVLVAGGFAVLVLLSGYLVFRPEAVPRSSVRVYASTCEASMASFFAIPPDSFVDIYVYFPDPNGQYTKTELVLESVRCLGEAKSPTRLPRNMTPAGVFDWLRHLGQQQKDYVCPIRLKLEVTARQAERLDAAEKRGRLHVVFPSPNEVTNEMITVDEVLKGVRPSLTSSKP
jgi:hypothetical protein